MIAETIALTRIFEDDTLRKALKEFFEYQAELASAQCAEFMWDDAPNVEAARKQACFAQAYTEAMNRLEAYAKQV